MVRRTFLIFNIDMVEFSHWASGLLVLCQTATSDLMDDYTISKLITNKKEETDVPKVIEPEPYQIVIDMESGGGDAKNTDCIDRLYVRPTQVKKVRATSSKYLKSHESERNDLEYTLNIYENSKVAINYCENDGLLLSI